MFLKHSAMDDLNNWLDVWKSTMAINLDSVGILTKMGLEHFRKNNGGRFVYIGSRAVFRGETEEYLAYAASKGGLTSLARSVARSFGKDNINAILEQKGCVGINIYHGIDNGQKNLILVGTTADEQDMENGLIAEKGLPCPPVCRGDNRLNSWNGR